MITEQDLNIHQGARWKRNFYFIDDQSNSMFSTGDGAMFVVRNLMGSEKLLRITDMTDIVVENGGGTTQAIILTPATGRIAIDAPGSLTAQITRAEAVYELFITKNDNDLGNMNRIDIQTNVVNGISYMGVNFYVPGDVPVLSEGQWVKIVIPGGSLNNGYYQVVGISKPANYWVNLDTDGDGAYQNDLNKNVQDFYRVTEFVRVISGDLNIKRAVSII